MRGSEPEMPCMHAPSFERNRDFVLDVLRGVLPAQGLVLEVGSGTGQHVAHSDTKSNAMLLNRGEMCLEVLNGRDATGWSHARDLLRHTERRYVDAVHPAVHGAADTCGQVQL